MERSAGDSVRRYFDLYAMILPYRVITVVRADAALHSSAADALNDKYSDAQLPLDASKYRQIKIQTADCSSLPGSHAGAGCSSEAAVRTKSGGEINLILTCDDKWETCRKLASGQTYGFDFVTDRSQKEECGPPSKETDCLRIHTQHYDLIYVASAASVTH